MNEKKFVTVEEYNLLLNLLTELCKNRYQFSAVALSDTDSRVALLLELDEIKECIAKLKVQP